MSDRDNETLRQELQKRRRAILETTRRTDAELDGLRAAERDPELEEGSQSEHEQSVMISLTDGERREVARIDAAIARVDAGEYGICQDCAQRIDPRRLAALPYALLCADCAERRERDEGTTEESPAP